VLFTRYFRRRDPETGNLIGASSDERGRHVRRLVEGAGNAFTYRSIPTMSHSMHGADPATYVATITEWIDTLAPVSGRPPSGPC
jgi:hypothetical protein